jgi:hypothetical protein
MAKKRARTERREAERAAVKLTEARIKLAKIDVGGSEGKPIEVTSASVIEVHATSLPCVSCGLTGTVRIEEHTAPTRVSGLRITKLYCSRCGYRRDLFFRIVGTTPLLS